jgi:hypothetical protein
MLYPLHGSCCPNRSTLKSKVTVRGGKNPARHCPSTNLSRAKNLVTTLSVKKLKVVYRL